VQGNVGASGNHSQTSGRSDTTFAERASLDVWYVKNWSLWYDIVILLRTVKVVFWRDGAY
jgi:undecaprenyl-phosphate galactose phosphotransferase